MSVPGSLLESLLNLGIYDEIKISLTVTDLSVLEALILVRKGMEALGEKLVVLGEDGNLALLGHVDFTLNANEVADVEVLPCLVLFFREIVDLCEDLDLAPSVVEIAEGNLTHASLGHETACNSDGLACE